MSYKLFSSIPSWHNNIFIATRKYTQYYQQTKTAKKLYISIEVHRCFGIVIFKSQECIYIILFFEENFLPFHCFILCLLNPDL